MKGLGAALLVLVVAIGAPSAHAQTSGPSFDCKRATSQVNRLICASPELSALDRKLADDFHAVLYQGGIDPAAVSADQDHWLHKVRNACTTSACIAAAYQTRDSDLLAQSIRAASPAVANDMQPFPAPQSAIALARDWIGKPCGDAPAKPLPQANRVPGMAVITTSHAYVSAMAIEGARFAVLLTYPGQDFAACRVADVVVLPRHVMGEQLMQCHMVDGDSYGFAIRTAKGATTAYWSTDSETGIITRQPIHVIGEANLRCQQPEEGE